MLMITVILRVSTLYKYFRLPYTNKFDLIWLYRTSMIGSRLNTTFDSRKSATATDKRCIT